MNSINGEPCEWCGSGSKFHMVSAKYCRAYHFDEISTLRAELDALRQTVVAAIGGFDDEGNPTTEINYLQRLRRLVENEKRLNG